MARNPIQFQLGLSLSAFLDQYDTEAQCRAALIKHRWPKGFVWFQLRQHRRHHLPRHATPAHTWFLAIYLLTQRKTGLLALQLPRELSVNYNSAWQLKHKLLQVMQERNQGETFTGRIEIDDAYLGGQWPGKRGRGAEHKVPFVAAVQTDDDGHPSASSCAA